MSAGQPGWRPTHVRLVAGVVRTSARPVRVRTDAGDAHFKVMGNPRGEHVLVAEYVGTRVAALLVGWARGRRTAPAAGRPLAAEVRARPGRDDESVTALATMDWLRAARAVVVPPSVFRDARAFGARMTPAARCGPAMVAATHGGR